MISSVTLEELEPAPDRVRAVIEDFDHSQLQRFRISEEISNLAEKYLADGVVSPAFRNDALHVAAATVHGADVIVSWNFRHIVNLRRIEAFNAVNLREGYGSIEIRTPKELVYGEGKGF